MERLTPRQEQEVKDFSEQLKNVDGPDDLFPPDSGVREPAPKPRPLLPPHEVAKPTPCIRLHDIGNRVLTAATLAIICEAEREVEVCAA